MPSVNLVILMGHLGKDPEMRYTTSGKAVATFSLATSEKWKGANDHWEENTVWHNIVCWGKQAEYANEYIHKGDPVYLEGKINNRSYEDKEGNKKYISEVVTRVLKSLKGKPQESKPESQQEEESTQDDLPWD
jgi:single-strand DNA-binding protein